MVLWLGDNHSVSLANIVVHYVISKTPGELKKEELFKRFIDNIWVSIDNIWASGAIFEVSVVAEQK